MAKLSDEEYEEFKKKVKECPLPIDGFNCAFYFPIVGKEANDEQIRTHLEVGLKRAAELGAEFLVVGSGSWRKIPENMSFEEGYAQFMNVLRTAGDIADGYGIDIVVEPLNERETNLINTVEQGLELCQKVAHKRVKYLADFYHMGLTGEGMEALKIADPEYLTHIHIATPDIERRVPVYADKADCEVFADALKKFGYAGGRITVEANPAEEYTECLRMLKEVFGN